MASRAAISSDLMVLLIGNYPTDQQESMQRFARMMQQGLTNAGVPAELIWPEPWLGRFRWTGRFAAKWLAYLDKFLFFPRRLKRRISRDVALVHICDHSNAMYAGWVRDLPVVVTCHDLLAVRGALGEDTGCPASPTGRILQRWITRSLGKADAIACDSQATLEDAQRLLTIENDRPRLEAITLGLSYPYRQLPAAEARARLVAATSLPAAANFVLHVGSNVGYKNREGVLRIFARCRDRWDGLLVCVGEPLSPALCSLGEELGIAARTIQLSGVSNEVLEALYNCAVALLFPSTSEGFGWPIAEAQACGCPVLCVNRPPMTEVAGAAGLTHDGADEAGFADDLMRLTDPAERARWSARSLENAKRFSAARMIGKYRTLYRSLASV